MVTKIIKVNPQRPEGKNIKRAAEVLTAGGLVIIPTETVYGIAADAHNPLAIERLYDIKQRPRNKPFSLIIERKERIEDFAKDIPILAYKLIDKFWPGPLTLVLSSQEGSIGLRMPDHPFALGLISKLNFPLVCPSANIAGRPAPKDIKEALVELKGKVDLAVDAGQTRIGLESTVVDLTRDSLSVLREGAIKADEINEIAKKKNILFVCTGNSCRSVMAKALLEKKLRESGRVDIQVSSAGIAMLEGLPTTPETLNLLKQEGLDVSSHRSQKVSLELIKKSDLILVMEKIQEETIKEWLPQLKNRLFLLKEFAKIDDSGDLNIPDPIGRPLQDYRVIFGLIKQAIERVSEVI